MDYNVRCFLEDMKGIFDDVNIDNAALFADAYAIFEADPTREGATKAAELYVSTFAEVLDYLISKTRSLIAEHRLNRSQCNRIGIHKKIERFERQSRHNLERLRTEFVDKSVNGTMDHMAEAAGAFSKMMEEALFS
ncbi:hypothetical protein [Azospirillum oryzae]|nr:hypothetical protein [Azospirillum oryzae]